MLLAWGAGGRLFVPAPLSHSLRPPRGRKRCKTFFWWKGKPSLSSPPRDASGRARGFFSTSHPSVLLGAQLSRAPGSALEHYVPTKM